MWHQEAPKQMDGLGMPHTSVLEPLAQDNPTTGMGSSIHQNWFSLVNSLKFMHPKSKHDPYHQENDDSADEHNVE